MVATLLLAMAPVMTYAALTPDNTGLKAAAPAGLLVNACESGANCIATIAGRVISTALGFIGILLLVLFLWGGFLWMTAGGEKEKVTKAQGVLANAVAGLVVIGISFAASTFVLRQLNDATVQRPAGYSEQLGY